jgi:hypothetical protein
MDDYEKGRLLGKGTFGSVFSATHKQVRRPLQRCSPGWAASVFAVVYGNVRRHTWIVGASAAPQHAPKMMHGSALRPAARWPSRWST